MKLGQINTLRINRETPIGLFLADDSDEEVLLPKRYVPDQYTIGDPIKVFLYNDSEDRLIATTETPMAVTNSFAYLEVTDIAPHGAFLNWGLMKDLFVPLRQQLNPMQVGKKYLVYVYVDQLTNRLVASSDLEKLLSDKPEDLSEGEEVKLIVWLRTDIGFRVVVNEEYTGMVYHNQLFQPLAEGDRTSGFVNRIREDGKLDILLQRPGVGNIDASAETLWQKLQEKGGFLPLTDNSSPEEIAAALNMSKKAFKKALGSLYKQRKISIQVNGIKMLK